MPKQSFIHSTFFITLSVALFFTGACGDSGNEPPGTTASGEGEQRPQLTGEQKPHIVFVTGDEEYRSEESMPMLARILKGRYGFRVSVCYALTDGIIDPNRLDNIEGLEVLDEADMMVLFTRFRQLPDGQLQHILDFAESGRPMAGFRTATHAFRYGEDHANHHLDNEWPQEVFGLPWIRHYGGENSTDVLIREERAGHPVLRGVELFHARSWLYHSDTLHEHAEPLLFARAVSGAQPGGDHFGEPHEVAWTHTYQGEYGTSRVFFTTLGHPYDFFNESMRKLSLNGIFWALGLEDRIPENGLDAGYVGGYDPNDAGFGEQYKQNMRPASFLPATIVPAGDHQPLHIHFISGSEEYESESSLMDLEQQIRNIDDRVKITASWGRDEGGDLPDIALLEEADLMVVFTRRMTLPDDQLSYIKRHIEEEKPVLGIRTASHAFQNFLEFDALVLGGDYDGHGGHEDVQVRFAEDAEGEVLLLGVKAWERPGMIYHNRELGPNTRVLLYGRGLESKIDEPLAWTNIYGENGRAFYTSMGFPSDFENENFIRLLMNAISWTTEQP